MGWGWENERETIEWQPRWIKSVVCFCFPPHAPMQRQQEALELPHATARLRRLSAPPQMQESRPSLADSKRAWPVAKARQPERQGNSVGP